MTGVETEVGMTGAELMCKVIQLLGKEGRVSLKMAWSKITVFSC